MKLTTARRNILEQMAEFERNGKLPQTSAEISLRLGKRFEWAGAKLASMHDRGLVRVVGRSLDNARRWSLTEDGYAAIGRPIDPPA